jgi:hypothetical protein
VTFALVFSVPLASASTARYTLSLSLLLKGSTFNEKLHNPQRQATGYNRRMKLSGILTTIIAFYGALLSTAVALRQWRTDRAKVRITVQRNMEMVGHPQYAGITLTVIKATNVGRRPVTITSLGALPLFPKNTGMVAVDTHPQLPHEITDGQYIESYWDQARIDLSTIDCWVAWDSHGRQHKFRVVSRYKHWKSERQRKREWKKNRKVRSAAAK